MDNARANPAERPRRHGVRRSAEDWLVSGFSYLFIAAYTLITLLPFLNVVSKAFSSEWALIANRVTFYPMDLQFQTMRYVFDSGLFRLSFRNSVFVTVLGTALAIFVGSLAAYPLAKRNFPLRKPILVAFVFTMLFSGGMIPTYLLMKDLKLINTLWALILPGSINVFNMLLIKNYYESIPESLEESARIDGANNLIILFRIMVPLALPVIATVCLFTAVGLWNDYFSAMIYNTSSAVKTLPLYLRDIIMDNMEDVSMKSSDDLMNILPEGVRSATIVASTLPILILYPFVQKYFIKGVMVGSVKG
ncbi:MAG TPA: carbohydrate ABC transporter permease [Clostridia bacterium]|nr:carbohydrate ABC transporter permease [Clostridia bacterium]